MDEINEFIPKLFLGKIIPEDIILQIVNYLDNKTVLSVILTTNDVYKMLSIFKFKIKLHQIKKDISTLRFRTFYLFGGCFYDFKVGDRAYGYNFNSDLTCNNYIVVSREMKSVGFKRINEIGNIINNNILYAMPEYIRAEKRWIWNLENNCDIEIKSGILLFNNTFTLSKIIDSEQTYKDLVNWTNMNGIPPGY